MELVLIALFPIIALCGGFYKFFYYNYAKKNYKKVEGVIVDYTIDYGDADMSTSFVPRVSYTINDQIYYKKANSLSYFLEKNAKKNIGKVVDVYYNEKNPKKAVLYNENGIPVIFLGLLFTILLIIHLYIN